jgi:YVTN family beta-propeller protein
VLAGVVGLVLIRPAVVRARGAMGAAGRDTGTPPGPGATTVLYVTNTRSESISIIDTGTLEVVGSIPLGRGKPNRVAFHPGGRQAWVVFDKSHDLGVVDAETHRLVKRVKIGGNPYNLAFSPDGRYLFVLDWSSEVSQDEVIAWDLKQEKIAWRVEVSTWPAHAVSSRDGRRLYVSGETAGDVTVIDTGTGTVVGRIVHGGGDAMGLALSPDEKVLYAAAGENKAILKIDTATLKVTGEIPLPGVVHEATLTLDGKFLYTTLRKVNKVVVIRTADDRIVATIPQRAWPDLVVMEPSGRYALVTNRYADLVTVIDVARHEPVKTIPVGKAPHGMALRPR